MSVRSLKLLHFSDSPDSHILRLQGADRLVGASESDQAPKIRSFRDDDDPKTVEGSQLLKQFRNGKIEGDQESSRVPLKVRDKEWTGHWLHSLNG